MNDSNDEFVTRSESIPPEPRPVDVESPVVEQPVPPVEPARPFEPEAPLAPEKPKGIPKTVWIAGGGCLLLICCAIVIAILAYFGLNLFGGGDPISSVVPASSLMYMSVDLTQTQSQNLADIVAVAQEMADEDTSQTVNDSLDELMIDELNMSFTKDVVPWIGRHAALVVTGGNFSSGDVEMMFILETRNRGKAREFVSKFVDALEDNQSMTFEQREHDGVSYYIDEGEASYEEDMVILQTGKFVYISNSEGAVFDSLSLQKKDSLGALDSYKQAMDALPKNRLATFFISGEGFVDIMGQMMNDMYGYGMGPGLSDMSAATEGIGGMAISVSAEDAGLRVDIASIYDPENLPDYQREMLNAGYRKPTTDELVPDDTFVFIAVNPSQSPFTDAYADNPLYSSDVTESFDLLEQEYGIRIQDLFGMLSGEFAFAMGPASDGLFVDIAQTNMGFTVLAATDDEQGFNEWFDNVLEVAFAQDSYTQYDVRDATVGDYDLKELSIDDGYQQASALIYGADNGYIVFGTSQSMLESGFTTDKTLANNETYRRTWQAFPAGSVPYMYVNVDGLMDFLVDAASQYEAEDFRLAQQKLEKMPVVAMSLNQTSGNVQTITMIFFIEKGK